MRLLCVTAALLFSGSSLALAKECRMPDGRILQLRVCRDRFQDRGSEVESQDSVRGSQGFIDLGNGTQVRIGGRIRAEVTGRR
jgi:hypothetical protein